MISCPKCHKSFKNDLALRMHTNRVHSKNFNKKMANGLKKRKYTKRNGKLTLDDAIVALTVKRDSFNEVLLILENLR